MAVKALFFIVSTAAAAMFKSLFGVDQSTWQGTFFYMLIWVVAFYPFFRLSMSMPLGIYVKFAAALITVATTLSAVESTNPALAKGLMICCAVGGPVAWYLRYGRRQAGRRQA